MAAARDGSRAAAKRSSRRFSSVAASSLTPGSCHRSVTRMREAAGGGRWVDVAPGAAARAGWRTSRRRHGAYRETGLTLIAEDGASAELQAPPGPGRPRRWPILREAQTPRRLGLLLARKGAVAVGIADGDELVASKVDTHYVQGRTAAGGWSQHRFARRRDNQAKAAAADGAGIVGRIAASRRTRSGRARHRRRPIRDRHDPRRSAAGPGGGAARRAGSSTCPSPGTRCWCPRWPGPGPCRS